MVNEEKMAETNPHSNSYACNTIQPHNSSMPTNATPEKEGNRLQYQKIIPHYMPQLSFLVKSN